MRFSRWLSVPGQITEHCSSNVLQNLSALSTHAVTTHQAVLELMILPPQLLWRLLLPIGSRSVILPPQIHCLDASHSNLFTELKQRQPMHQHPIEAVIFDCDGTLVDSETLSISLLLDFASEFGPNLEYEDALQQFAGVDLAVVIQSIELQLGHALPDDFMERFRTRQLPILREHVQAIHGAKELLEALNRPVCVASNAPLSKINVCLETTELDQFFTESRIFSAYQIETWKPSPDLFLMAADFLQVAPECCAVVEDSGSGIEAGLAAGMQVFAFDPHQVHETNTRITAVRCLTDLIPALCE